MHMVIFLNRSTEHGLDESICKAKYLRKSRLKNKRDMMKPSNVQTHKQSAHNLGLFIACAAGALASQSAVMHLFDGASGYYAETKQEEWANAVKGAIFMDMLMLPSVIGAQRVYNQFAYHKDNKQNAIGMKK
jgi:hypothetical protein